LETPISMNLDGVPDTPEVSELSTPAVMSPGESLPADPNITACDAENAAMLTLLGYTADPETAWGPGEWAIVGTYPFYWDGVTWQPGVVPTPIITASPGMQLPADPNITASDDINAGALGILPYDAQPHRAWAPGEYVLIGAYPFYWNGGDWRPGVVPVPDAITVSVQVNQADPTDKLVQFDASGTTSSHEGVILTFGWDFGDGTELISDESTPMHLYPAAGMYNVNLLVGQEGYAGSSTALTVVIEQPAAPTQLAQGGTYDIPEITASDMPNALRLNDMGYVGSPTSAWSSGTKVVVTTFDFFWDGNSWMPGISPTQAIQVAPGSTLPANPQITGDEQARCALLPELGYTASPQTPWRDQASATIGTDHYFWDGAEWHSGQAPAAFITLAPGQTNTAAVVSLDPSWTTHDVAWIWRPHYGANPLTAWSANQLAKVQNNDPLRWNGTDWVENLSRAAPGMVFMPNPQITTSDAANAARLTGLGFAPADARAWASNDWIYLGEHTRYAFRWSGSAWQSVLQYIPPAAVNTTMFGDTRVLMADQTTADKLTGYGYVAAPQTAWLPKDKVLIGTVPFHWAGSSWRPRAAPNIAHPGDVFPADPNITGQDDLNASMVAVDYVASPTTAWGAGASVAIGEYYFTWGGAAWTSLPLQ